MEQMPDKSTKADEELFTLALGLTPPWAVTKIAFEGSPGELHLYLDFVKGSVFPCPVCSRLCHVYDSDEATWRHLNFFQYKCYLHARKPRVECPDHKVLTVGVPWSRPDSGFSLLFEALAMMLVRQMPVAAAGRIVGEHDTRLWRIINYYVAKSRAREDFSNVSRVGTDETASRRGHKYVSLFADVEKSKVIFATEGKDSATVKAFRDDFKAHQGKPENVTEFVIDMSPAFIAGVTEHFSGAAITFDRFHVIKLANEALDEVRRQEQTGRPELKHSRYVWLKNQANHTVGQAAIFTELSQTKLKTARGYRIKLALQEFYQQPVELAEPYLKKWYYWATHSRLQPFIELANTIKTHWDGVLRYATSKLTTGVLEGINSLVQAAKARARGYRNSRNFISMIYLIAGKLDFSWLLTPTHS
jgi:transposase